jgi:hypothetical protein
MLSNSLSRDPYSSPRQRTAPFDSPAQLAIVGGVVWLIGIFVHIHALAFLAPLGLALLVVAALAYLLRPRRQSMYWRGRKIDLDGRAKPTDGLYRLLFRR